MMEYKASATLSKKKYTELQQALQDKYEQEDDRVDVESVLEIIRTVLRFDPNLNSYNDVRAEQIREYRRKQKEAGVSTYVSSGAKSTYYKNKIAMKST
jgi:hypothetical protein